MEQYRILACRQNGELMGYCILRIKEFSGDSRMGNSRVGTILDCLFDPDDSKPLQSLLASSVRLLRRERADAIFCTASHFQVQKLLRRNGFIKVPGNLNFAYHDRSHAIPQKHPLSSWHLMRADSDADGNF
jgi:hypothetical protein